MKCRTCWSSLLSTYLRSLVLLSVWILLHLQPYWNSHVTEYPLKISRCLTQKYRKWSSGSLKTALVFTPLCVHTLSLSLSPHPLHLLQMHTLLREKSWKMLHSLWPSLSPDVCIFSLSLCTALRLPSLSQHSLNSHDLQVGAYRRGGCTTSDALLVIMLAGSSFLWLFLSARRWASIQ